MLLWWESPSLPSLGLIMALISAILPEMWHYFWLLILAEIVEQFQRLPLVFPSMVALAPQAKHSLCQLYQLLSIFRLITHLNTGWIHGFKGPIVTYTYIYCLALVYPHTNDKLWCYLESPGVHVNLDPVSKSPVKVWIISFLHFTWL